jgi:hypothetical protein
MNEKELDRMSAVGIAQALGLHLIYSDSGELMLAIAPEPNATAGDVVYDSVESARDALRATLAPREAGPAAGEGR